MLHHVEVYVSDLQATIRFYDWLLVRELGYYEYQRWDSGISYKSGETYIVFVQTGDEFLSAKYDRRRTGLNHLAFFACENGQLDRIKEYCQIHDVTILYPEQYPNDHDERLFIQDPDGIKIELVGSAKAGVM